MYRVAIKVDGIENRKKSVGVLHIVVGFYLLIKSGEISSNATNGSYNLIALLILLLAIVSLIYGFSRKRLDPYGKYNMWLRLLQIITLLYFGISVLRSGTGSSLYNVIFFIWSALFTMMLFLERRIFLDTEIKFTNEGIIVPGLYKDHEISWNVLEDVIVRHDFITIFNKNKKYLQYQVLQDLSALEIAKMNAFCREKIEQTKR
ncbi:MAG TPA: hypothetical protein VM368_05855 [Flavisolibacter sp.]|nr:hypothetical protein [Flavisolibacter sp.]